MLSAEKLAKREALHQRLRDFALASNRALMLGEQINPGDEYIYNGPFELKICVCRDLSLFSKVINPTDDWETVHKLEKCYKIAPIPRPNEQTIMEKLQFLQDEIASLRALILRLSGK